MKEIIDLDSDSAVTIFSFVGITRKNPKEDLGMLDLQNYISQAIWKFFDSSRSGVAERLGVDEVDMLLTDARVMGIKIDGHRVVNPQGFTGKKLEIFMVITMVRRDKFVDSAYLFEGGSIRAYLLAKKLNFEDIIYVEVSDTTTTIFVSGENGIKYIDSFEWGGRSLVDSIEREFQVKSFTADGIYTRHANGMVSENVGKRLDKLFYDTFEYFVNGVTESMKSFLGSRKRNAPSVHLRTFFPVPESVHRKRFPLGDKRIRFLSSVGESELNVFVEDEVHDVYSELNDLARRRIKWLMPTS